MRKPVSRDTLLQKVRTAVHLFMLRTKQDSNYRHPEAPVTRPRTASPSEIEPLEEYQDKTTDM
jgi:hypothetical protein